MNQKLVSTNTDFPTVFRIANSTQTLPMPFAREIFLLKCHIAGTTFRLNIAEIEPRLQIGTKLRLEREMQNEFDALAIAVYDGKQSKIGYVPKAQNEVLARLLDAGKNLSAKLKSKEWNGMWLKLDIEIFLHN